MHCIVDIAIKNINQIYESIGSGFIFDGYIFTCSHVVDGHKKFHITTCDGRKIKGKEYYFTKEQIYSVTFIISITKAIIGEVLTEIPNLPCSYTSQYKEKWHFRNKTFF